MKDIKSRLEHKDKQIIEKIYLTYSKELFYYAYAILKNADDAQDIVDQAFMNWINKSPNISKSKDIFKYLLTITKNLALNHIRDTEKYYFFGTDEGFDIEDYPDPQSINIKDKLTTKVFLETILTIDEYTILYYRQVYEYDFKSIAKLFNVSVRVIRSRYNKIVNKIKNYIKEEPEHKSEQKISHKLVQFT